MFDMAAAFAATTPGPSLAYSPGLKPKNYGGLFCVLGGGARALWQGWKAVECTLVLWQDESCSGFTNDWAWPGLAVASE